jgi:hypothetical protein
MFTTYSLHHSGYHFLVPDFEFPFICVFLHLPLPLSATYQPVPTHAQAVLSENALANAVYKRNNLFTRRRAIRPESGVQFCRDPGEHGAIMRNEEHVFDEVGP